MSVEVELISGKITKRVDRLLFRFPELRDNDKLLYLAYLDAHHAMKSILATTKDPYGEIRKLILDRDTPMFESVSRARRKLQEYNPLLRGKAYKKKHESAERIREAMK